MTDQIEVRFAEGMDLDGCIALDHPEMLAEVIQRKVEQREIIVAEKAGQLLVGYLRLDYLWSFVPYIALIWVVEDQRQQGIGRAILRYLENVMKLALYSTANCRVRRV
jgi:ribosomal protein S18 acetylase RimI-like enzyme